MGGHDLPKLPDWRTYKIEGIPELEWTKKALELHGLKDPWLRNEAWRFIAVKSVGTPVQRYFAMFTHGLKYGFALAVVSATISRMIKSQSHHDDHGEHGGAHH